MIHKFLIKVSSASVVGVGFVAVYCVHALDKIFSVFYWSLMKTPAGRFQMKSWASRSSYRLRFQKYRGSCGKVHVERSQVLNESEDYFEARKAYQQMTKLKMSFFPKISLLFQILLVCHISSACVFFSFTKTGDSVEE